jgi:hypothetical protein
MAGICVALLAGCASTPRPSDSPAVPGQAVTSVPSATGVVASDPVGGWLEPANYSFTVESSCGERSLIGRFRVTVEGHRTVAFTGLDESGRRYPGDAGSIPTLGGILKEADDATAGNADSVNVETDPADGHPVSVAIDWRANAIDDEACYRVTDYDPAI